MPYSDAQTKQFAEVSNFEFPLNVYAYALLLEEGQLDYLHYGLFKNVRSALKDAQAYSTRIIFSQLPKTPCKILEVGVGLGTTLQKLTEDGHQCEGLTPDKAQIDYIQNRYKNLSVHCQKLEDSAIKPNNFDVVLLQESAQYIDPLVIFNQALEGLNTNGSLIILDEFSLNNTQNPPTHLHFLENFIALGKRLGFELTHQSDLSYFAAPTLDYLLTVTQKNRALLLTNLKLSPEQLDGLNDSNRSYQQQYSKGDYGYTLLHFKKRALAAHWRLKPYVTEDFKQIQGLFQCVFDEDLTAEFWQWKYSSQSKALCLWKESEIIAHYGGIPRAILYFSQPQLAVQIGDVMVHPSQRGTPAFFHLASTFLERYLGTGKPFLLGFGFPNERAMKIAEHYSLYEEVDQMGEVSWAVSSSLPCINSRLQVIDSQNITQFKPIIDTLWQQMAEDLRDAIVGIRDAEYITQRYLNHPRPIYHIFAVKQRFSNQFHGILILTFKDNRCDIVDLIAPLNKLPLLLIHAQRLAFRHNCTHLFSQISHRFSTYFTSEENHYTLLDIRIPTSIWNHDKAQADTLKNHWWLMGGDMDFR
jgi:2-polyprenyl-3-methyl-5-hydroxy-6-metoxy-1,4-benzoquinol methylase